MDIERLHDLIIKRDNQCVYVLVPAQDVLLTHVLLPKLNRQRLLQALPFALEEKLITDLSELHFAIGDYQADGMLPVAIVSKQKMQQWLAILNEAAIFPTAMLPMQFALPNHANEWAVCIHENDCVVRTGVYSGFFCDASNLDLLLADLHPDKVTLYHFNDLPLLAKWDPGNLFINLLQPPYQRKYNTLAQKKTWLYSAYALAASIFLMLSGYVVSWVILQRAVNAGNLEINQIYKQQFPEARSVVAPKERMESKLKKLASPSQNDFLYVLGLLGEAIKKSPGVKISRLDYHNHMVMMTIVAPAFEKMDLLVQALKQKGLVVKQENATNVGLDVTAELQISKGAA